MILLASGCLDCLDCLDCRTALTDQTAGRNQSNLLPPPGELLTAGQGLRGLTTVLYTELKWQKVQRMSGKINL